MTWLELVPAILVGTVLLFVPGLPIAWACGARGLGLPALGAGASIGVVALTSVLAGWAGIPWGFLPLIAVSALVTLVAFFVRRRFAPAKPSGRSARLLVPATIGGVLGGVILLAALIAGIGTPEHPNQLFDAVFHYNAVQFIAETGTASPLDMTMSVPGRASSFYPTVWHAMVALVVPVAGGQVIAATNAFTVAVVAVLWPVAVMYLVSVLWPKRPIAVAFGGAFSAGFAVFPLGMLSWGVLFPNLLGMAAVPIALALLIALLGRTEAPRVGPAVGWPLLALAVLGLTLAHPNALFALIALAAPPLASALLAGFRGSSSLRTRLLLVGVGLAYVAGALVLWSRARPTDTRWEPFESVPAATGEVLWMAPVGRPIAVVLAVLVIVGVVGELLRRRYWVVGSYAVSVAFYLVSAALTVAAVRTFIVGIWYNDTTRVASMLAVVGIPLAAFGGSLVVDWCLRGLGSTRFRDSGGARRVVVIGVFVVLVAGSQVRTLNTQVPFLRDEAYRFDEQSAILSPDEVAIFDDVERIVPDGEMVAGNPWSGSSLAYAYTGREVLFPHINGSWGDARLSVGDGLADDADELCAVLDDLDITYVLDFGDRYVIDGYGDTPKYAGLNDLDESPFLEQVARHGDAALYQITACD